MKLFLKTLLFIITLFTTVEEAKSSTVVNFSFCEFMLSPSLTGIPAPVLNHTSTSEPWGIPNLPRGEAGITYSSFNVGDLIFLGMGVKALVSAGAKIFGTRAADGAAHVVARDGMYSVYQGFNAAGEVGYVGITSRTPAVRFAEHAASNTARSSLRYRVVSGAEGLTKTQARIWEQNLINQHGLGNLLNLRNSIDPKYWWMYGIKP